MTTYSNTTQPPHTSQNSLPMTGFEAMLFVVLAVWIILAGVSLRVVAYAWRSWKQPVDDVDVVSGPGNRRPWL